MGIPGAWRVSPKVIVDSRGSFSEWFRSDQFESATGFNFMVAQGNISRSKKGVVRGVHFADVPPGQAKCVMPVTGRILDFVVDIRVGSPTFGKWDSTVLDSVNHDAVLVEPGLGHGFVSLEDDSTVCYLVSDIYRPDREHEINPADPAIGIEFPDGLEIVFSDKDAAAPSLAEAQAAGILPVWGAR